MSLQVWLPLNGNLDNYGLSNVSVTNSGATVNDSGKIGKCYEFNGSSSLTIGYLNGLSSEDKSVSMWVKPNGANDSKILFRTEGTSPGRFYFGIKNGTWNIAFGSTAWGYTSAAVVDVDNWQHIVVTVKNNVASVYLNGVFSYSKSNTSFIFPSNLILSPSSAKFNGLIADVRIYDHCLSPKEVKEISKGLVLHYKFDDPYIFMSKYSTIVWNQLAQPTNASQATSKNATYSRSDRKYVNIQTTQDGVSGTGSQIISTNYLTENSIADTNVFRQQAGHKYYSPNTLPQGFYFSQNVFSGGVIPFNGSINTGVRPSNQSTIQQWSLRGNGGTVVNEFTQCPLMIFDLTQMFGDGNEPTVEEFEMMFPAPYYPYNVGTQMTLNYKTVYDHSGYNNNGTITGALSVSNDSPRYELSTKFNGANYIYRTPLDCSSEVKTISFWANWDSIPSGQSVLFVDNGTKTGFGLMSTGILLTTSGAGSSYTYPKSSLTANTWYNFVIIITGTTTRDLYINGVKQTATSSASNWSYTVNQLQIGKRSSTSDGFAGKMSDFRMYTTALSEDDIKELYDTAALIDNGHNLHCYEFVEDDVTSPTIEKNGLVKTNEFNEYPDDYIFYDYIQSNGNQWIDTGIKGHMNYTYELEFQQTDTGNYRNWGVLGQSSYVGPNMSLTYASGFALRWENLNNNERLISATSSINTNKHFVKIVNGQLYWDGVNKGKSPGHKNDFVINHNLFLGTVNPGGTTPSYNAKSKYYLYKVYDENGILIQNLIPAKHKSDNEIGMYDMVTGRFFGNSGTGTFTTGTAIDVAAMYEQKIDLNQLLEI